MTYLYTASRFGALALFLALPVFCENLTFLGEARGCFTDGCTPTEASSIRGVTYLGSTFGGTTSDGFLALGGEDNGFGKLATQVVNQSYSRMPFTLLLNFFLPSGIGGNPLYYAATINGSLRTGAGGLSLIFDRNGPYSYSFETGSFDLVLNNLAVSPGGAASINGFVTNADSIPGSATPELSSLIMLTSGLACVFLAKMKSLFGAPFHSRR